MTKAKNITKALTTVAILASLGACSTMETIDNRESYAQPDWYKTCAEAGTEGWFWWEKDFAYACGAGESTYQQAAEEQMSAIAMNNFAKRINGTVNSKTSIQFVNDVKSTNTYISYNVTNTSIREHLAKETGTYTLGGKFYTFVKLKLEKSLFDALVNEAKATKQQVLNKKQ